MILVLYLMLTVLSGSAPALVYCEKPVTAQTDESNVPDPSEDYPPAEPKNLAVLPAPIEVVGRDEEDNKGRKDNDGRTDRSSAVPPQIRGQ